MTIRFEDLEPGLRIVDEWNQRCVVEDIDNEGRMVTTRRYEGRTYWDGVATWSEAQFNGRRWWKLWRGSVPRRS